MKILANILILLIFVSSAAIAKPATEKSIKQILTITHSRKILAAVRNQIDYSVDSIVQRTLKGKQPTAEQKKIIKKFTSKTDELVAKTMTWKKFEASDILIYKQTFTEKEIQGILSFYKSPAGRAFNKKMPIVAHKRLTEVRKLASKIEPQLQKISRDFLTQMRATSSHSTKSPK